MCVCVCNAQKNVEEFKLHLEQFEVQRAYVKEIEENLKVGEVLVFKVCVLI